MAERIMPGMELRAFYAPGQGDWGTSVSEDLRTLSVLVQARALSRTTPLPASGTTGDIYLVPDDAAENAHLRGKHHLQFVARIGVHQVPCARPRPRLDRHDHSGPRRKRSDGQIDDNPTVDRDEKQERQRFRGSPKRRFGCKGGSA